MFWFETAPWPRGLIGLQNESTAFPLIRFAGVQLNSFISNMNSSGISQNCNFLFKDRPCFSLFYSFSKLYTSVKKRKTIFQGTKASQKKTFLKRCSGLSHLDKEIINYHHSQVTLCTRLPHSQSKLPSHFWLASPHRSQMTSKCGSVSWTNVFLLL